MDQIKVNTNELRSESQNLNSSANDIGDNQNQLSRTNSSIGNAYDGQLRRAVEGITGDVQPRGTQLRNRSLDLGDELVSRAVRFENANDAGGSAMIVMSHQLNDFIEASPILRIFSFLKKSELAKASLLWGMSGLGFGGILGLITFFPKISSLLFKNNYRSMPISGQMPFPTPVPTPTPPARSDKPVDSADNKTENQPILTTDIAKDAETIGKPSVIGTLGLHGKDNNARDYISSRDPGKSSEDQQRKRINGREIRAFEKGEIKWISFDDESNPTRIRQLTEDQKNPRGITMAVYYPESGYFVQYTHIVPSDKILKLAGVSDVDLPTTNLKTSFKTALVEPGEIIGNYNQIGWSTAPHLHLTTYKYTNQDEKIAIDPASTDIPQRTLF